ncbi:MAG: TonB-dependent receptor plug domain-containing protein [Bacteroidales bacterium]|nr:TonB-dependent receptor plug domain-containing protein [Bacteroidales bacterium]
MTEILALCLAAGISAATFSEEIPSDTTSANPWQEEDAVLLQESVATAVLAPRNAPFAVSNISRDALEKFSSESAELPFLLTGIPGVTATSDNGIGSGTSYLRIRGCDGSRINVTIDGVSLNSPEDETVFWANMNSYSDFLSSVQVRRGVGPSTCGDGAFGGSIALTTKDPSPEPSIRAGGSYGSFNTFKGGINLSSGRLWNHLSLDGGFNASGTDGYVDGTAGRSGSYYGAAIWKGNNFTLRYRHIGNFEHTGQAWNGVEGGSKSYRQLYEEGLGRHNNLIGAADHFRQNHNILSAAWAPAPQWNLSAALRYSGGSGYYTETKKDCALSKFGLSEFIGEDGSIVKTSDLTRKKGLDEHTWSTVLCARWKNDRLSVSGGVHAQFFKAWHYGYLTGISNPSLAEKIGDMYRYYSSDARKNEVSPYVKVTWDFARNWSAYADIQYRHVFYTTDGQNDKFVIRGGGIEQQMLDVREFYDFLNPKAGVSFHSGPHSAFACWAMSSREPQRNNFTDNGHHGAPRPEHLLDYEAGYSFSGKRVSTCITLYYMDFRDQLVQTGEISDIGEALTANVAKSLRTGAEITASWKVNRHIDLNAAAAFSLSRIKDFEEVVDDWDSPSGARRIHYDSTPIAFSPAVTAGAGLNFHLGSLSAALEGHFVSRQYLDNTASADRSLPAYGTLDLRLDYRLDIGAGHPAAGRIIPGIDFFVKLGNMSDSHHAASGWVYSAVSESQGYTPEKRYMEFGWFPVAGFTATGGISIDFFGND